MQQVLLNINNKELEVKLRDEAYRRGSQLDDLIIGILEENFLDTDERQGVSYRTLDPLKYLQDIRYPLDEKEDLSDVKPFADITNSSEYIHESRKKMWNRQKIEHRIH